MHDSRLIGMSKSSARKTAREIWARLDVPATKKRKLRNLFGKLELRFTRTRCYSQFDEHRAVHRYVVVAKDSGGVAIVTFDPIWGPQISHIHFEDNCYWICVRRIRKYFKRKKRYASRLR